MIIIEITIISLQDIFYKHYTKLTSTQNFTTTKILSFNIIIFLN